jgi:hypothetical protein
MDSKYWARVVHADIHKVSGRNYPHLYGALEEMEVAVLRDLHRLMQDVEQEVMTAKKTYQPFPGGPRMRF